MPQKCALSHGSGVLGRDPRDSYRFWSPHVEKVCTVTQFRLGEGGGGDTIGGGAANREPGSYMPVFSAETRPRQAQFHAAFLTSISGTVGFNNASSAEGPVAWLSLSKTAVLVTPLSTCSTSKFSPSQTRMRRRTTLGIRYRKNCRTRVKPMKPALLHEYSTVQ